MSDKSPTSFCKRKFHKNAVTTNIKSPGKYPNPGHLRHVLLYTVVFFSHPDFTVGFGISPNQPPKRVADYTAGREFRNCNHPTPKNFLLTETDYTIYAYSFQEILLIFQSFL